MGPVGDVMGCLPAGWGAGVGLWTLAAWRVGVTAAGGGPGLGIEPIGWCASVGYVGVWGVGVGVGTGDTWVVTGVGRPCQGASRPAGAIRGIQ